MGQTPLALCTQNGVFLQGYIAIYIGSDMVDNDDERPIPFDKRLGPEWDRWLAATAPPAEGRKVYPSARRHAQLMRNPDAKRTNQKDR